MMSAITIRNLTLGEGQPKICVPITGRSLPEIESALLAMRGGVFDLIEWRADKFDALRDPAALKKAAGQFRAAYPDKPIIFTIRTNVDMEDFDISTKVYRDLNLFMMEHTLSDLVDIEYSRGDTLVREMTEAAHLHHCHVICSRHLRDRTPETTDILQTLLAMQATGADLVKYAAMPRSPRDVLHLMDATLAFQEKQTGAPCITMSMGRLGAVSRISGQLTGSCLTFGTIGEASAPGQIPCDRLKMILDTL